MNESGIAKNRIISELTRSSHGDLGQYVPTGSAAAKEDPEFFGHLVSWNRIHGSVRDSKTALPVIALTGVSGDDVLRENALAHIASLDPRNLVRAVRFAMSVRPGGNLRKIRRVVERYLRAREASPKWFERTVLQHRQSVKELYALLHIKPSPWANQILFTGPIPEGTAFAAVRDLAKMGPVDARAAIAEHKIPFLVAVGALGGKAKEPDTLMAARTTRHQVHSGSARDAGSRADARAGIRSERAQDQQGGEGGQRREVEGSPARSPGEATRQDVSRWQLADPGRQVVVDVERHRRLE